MSQISSRYCGSVNTNREYVNVLLTDGSFRLLLLMDLKIRLRLVTYKHLVSVSSRLVRPTSRSRALTSRAHPSLEGVILLQWSALLPFIDLEPGHH